jgi:hypothetical protein
MTDSRGQQEPVISDSVSSETGVGNQRSEVGVKKGQFISF